MGATEPQCAAPSRTLRQPGFVQLHVSLAAKPVLAIPRGLSVADKDEASHWNLET